MEENKATLKWMESKLLVRKQSQQVRTTPKKFSYEADRAVAEEGCGVKIMDNTRA